MTGMTDMVGVSSAVQASARAMPLRGHRRMLDGLAPWLLLAPSLVFLALFTYGPVLQVLADSLYLRKSLNASPSYAGMENYRAIFTDAAFRKSLINTALYAVATLDPEPRCLDWGLPWHCPIRHA